MNPYLFYSVIDMSFKSICESSSENINCPFGYDINVTYANYGRLPEVKTLSCPTSQPNANCSSSKSLPYVKNRCDGIRSCDLGASDSYFGDPCSGVKKTLDVLYECEIGKLFTLFQVQNFFKHVIHVNVQKHNQTNIAAFFVVKLLLPI